MDLDRTLDAVGPRLKELRQRRDITLRALSAEFLSLVGKQGERAHLRVAPKGRTS